MVKCIGVGPGNVRGLDLLKVVFDIFDLVVNVLLLAIRPQPVLTLCHRHDRKTFRYVPLNKLSLNDYNVPLNHRL